MTSLEAAAWGLFKGTVGMEIENYLGGCFEIELFGPCYKVFRIPSPAENLYFLIIGIVALYVCDYPIF